MPGTYRRRKRATARERDQRRGPSGPRANRPRLYHCRDRRGIPCQQDPYTKQAHHGSVPVIRTTRSVAVPPATVTFISKVQGEAEHVAPSALNVWSTGDPFRVPAAHPAVPQVSAPV